MSRSSTTRRHLRDPDPRCRRPRQRRRTSSTSARPGPTRAPANADGRRHQHRDRDGDAAQPGDRATAVRRSQPAGDGQPTRASVDVVNPDIELTKTATPDRRSAGRRRRWLTETGHVHVHRHQHRRRAAEPPRRATRRDRPECDRPGLGRRPATATRPRSTSAATPTTTSSARPRRDLDVQLPHEVTDTIRPVNIATIIGQPSHADGHAAAGIDPVRGHRGRGRRGRHARASTSSRPRSRAVLDPDATPVAGPDVPDPRPAEYLYEVTNTGNVPLVAARSPPTDDICAPLVSASGGRHQRRRAPRPGRGLGLHLRTTLERRGATRPPVRRHLRPGQEHGDRDRRTRSSTAHWSRTRSSRRPTPPRSR